MYAPATAADSAVKIPEGDTADDDDDEQDARNGINEVLEQLGSRQALGGRVLVLLCNDECDCHAGEAPQDARNIAGHDHADNRGARQNRVDDEDAGLRISGRSERKRCRLRAANFLS